MDEEHSQHSVQQFSNFSKGCQSLPKEESRVDQSEEVSSSMVRKFSSSLPDGQKKAENPELRMNKKKSSRKVRLYVSDFEPYLPEFLNLIEKQHYPTVIRIGKDYQAQVPPGPAYCKIYRPLSEICVWKGSREKFSNQAYKKFKQTFGEYRTEEELIHLKHKQQVDSWPQLVKEFSSKKGQQKKALVSSGRNRS